MIRIGLIEKTIALELLKLEKSNTAVLRVSKHRAAISVGGHYLTLNQSAGEYAGLDGEHADSTICLWLDKRFLELPYDAAFNFRLNSELGTAEVDIFVHGELIATRYADNHLIVLDHDQIAPSIFNEATQRIRTKQLIDALELALEHQDKGIKHIVLSDQIAVTNKAAILHEENLCPETEIEDVSPWSLSSQSYEHDENVDFFPRLLKLLKKLSKPGYLRLSNSISSRSLERDPLTKAQRFYLDIDTGLDSVPTLSIRCREWQQSQVSTLVLSVIGKTKDSDQYLPIFKLPISQSVALIERIQAWKAINSINRIDLMVSRDSGLIEVEAFSSSDQDEKTFLASISLEAIILMDRQKVVNPYMRIPFDPDNLLWIAANQQSFELQLDPWVFDCYSRGITNLLGEGMNSILPIKIGNALVMPLIVHS